MIFMLSLSFLIDYNKTAAIKPHMKYNEMLPKPEQLNFNQVLENFKLFFILPTNRNLNTKGEKE